MIQKTCHASVHGRDHHLTYLIVMAGACKDTYLNIACGTPTFNVSVLLKVLNVNGNSVYPECTITNTNSHTSTHEPTRNVNKQQ